MMRPVKTKAKLVVMFVLFSLFLFSTNSIADIKEPVVDIKASATIVNYGKSVLLTGTVKPEHPGETISITKTPYGGTSQIANVVQSNTGTFSYSHKPNKNTSYSATFNHGGTDYKDSLNVRVKPGIALTVSKSSPYINQPTVFTATISPNRQGSTAYIQRYTSSGWSTVKTATINSSSKITFTFKPPAARKYLFRAVYKADNEFIKNVSTAKAITAIRPFVAVVQSSYTYNNSQQQGIYYTSRVNTVYDLLAQEFTKYAVKKIYDKDVANLSTLKKYKVVVFINMTCVSQPQRSAIRDYVKSGGKIIASFGMARNDYDGIQLIYKHQFASSWDLSRYWEWEEVSEVYQLKFNNDPLMERDYRINSGSSTHPIITRTKNDLNLSKLNLYSSKPDYNELMWRMANNPNVTPILFYDTKSNSSSSDNSSHGFGAAWVSKYYKGMSVYYNFMLHDFFWDPARKSYGKNYQISKTLFLNTVKWLKSASTSASIAKTTNPTASAWLSGYSKAGYTLNVKHTVRNTGNIQLRGKYFVEIYRNGSLVHKNQTTQPVPLGPSLSWTYNCWKLYIGTPSTSLNYGIKVGSYYYNAAKGGWVKAYRTYTYKYQSGKLYYVSSTPVVVE